MLQPTKCFKSQHIIAIHRGEVRRELEGNTEEGWNKWGGQVQGDANFMQMI
jgi:hypothetical protein